MKSAVDVCRLSFCDRPVHLKRDQLCQAHYTQQRAGKELVPARRSTSVGRPYLRDDAGRKQCSSCREWLSTTLYAVNRTARDGLQVCCKPCRNQVYRENRPAVLEKRLVRLYGIGKAEIAAMVALQGGGCASCGKVSPVWCVDHNHACCPGNKTCGRCVRGILCSGCNLAIGLAGDDPANLRSMAGYLERVSVV